MRVKLLFTLLLVILFSGCERPREPDDPRAPLEEAHEKVPVPFVNVDRKDVVNSAVLSGAITLDTQPPNIAITNCGPNQVG